jgi:ABC-type amino acid transport substrate-binding protein
LDIKKKFFIGILVFYVFSVQSGEVKSEPTFRLAHSINTVNGWVPYSYSGNDAFPGVFIEMTNLIMQKAKIPTEGIPMPTKRAVKALEEGLIDFDYVSPEWFSYGNVGENYVKTLPLFTVTEYFISLPVNAEKYNSLQDIYGNPVGTVAGYYYYDDSKFTRMDFLSERKLVQGLAYGRFEVVILEQRTAEAWSNRLNIPITLLEQHTQGNIVIRLRKEHAAYLPQINQAIRTLQELGKVRDILDSYNVLH